MSPDKYLVWYCLLLQGKEGRSLPNLDKVLNHQRKELKELNSSSHGNSFSSRSNSIMESEDHNKRFVLKLISPVSCLQLNINKYFDCYYFIILLSRYSYFCVKGREGKGGNLGIWRERFGWGYLKIFNLVDINYHSFIYLTILFCFFSVNVVNWILGNPKILKLIFECSICIQDALHRTG